MRDGQELRIHLLTTPSTGASVKARGQGGWGREKDEMAVEGVANMVVMRTPIERGENAERAEDGIRDVVNTP